jgi:hypothetical protein
MVGSAGNAPVRPLPVILATPDLQAGNRITSRRDQDQDYDYYRSGFKNPFCLQPPT